MPNQDLIWESKSLNILVLHGLSRLFFTPHSWKVLFLKNDTAYCAWSYFVIWICKCKTDKSAKVGRYLTIITNCLSSGTNFLSKGKKFLQRETNCLRRWTFCLFSGTICLYSGKIPCSLVGRAVNRSKFLFSGQIVWHWRHFVCLVMLDFSGPVKLPCVLASDIQVQNCNSRLHSATAASISTCGTLAWTSG